MRRQSRPHGLLQAAAEDRARRRQRPARLPLQAAAAASRRPGSRPWSDRSSPRASRRGVASAPAIGAGRRRRASSCSPADRLRDRRLAGRRRLLRGLRRAARPDARRQRPAAARRRRCCARATTATPSAPSPARSPTASTASSPSTPTRKRPPTARATSRPTTTATRSAWSRSPSASAHVPELYCQRKFGLRALEKFEDVFRGSKERVKLESEALDKHYEIFVAKEQDQVWLRQLFSPTFIVWLTEAAPEEVRLRARRRHPLLLRQRPQGERRRPRPIAAATAAPWRRGCARRRSEYERRSSPPRPGTAQKPASRTSALAIRPAAIISRTEGTRTRATTSWIFGAARAARSSTARRWSRRRALAWRRSWSASGEPKRRERSIEAPRVAISLPGTRARRAGERRRRADGRRRARRR